MLKCNVNKKARGMKVSVEAYGDAEELTDDIGNIIHSLYWYIKDGDPEMAEEFKEILQGNLADDGVVWKPLAELMKEE